MFHHDAQRTGKSTLSGPDNCKLKWSYEILGNIYGAPVLDASHSVYIGSADTSTYGQYENRFYSIDSDGSLSWSYYVREAIWSSAAIFNDLVYIGVEDGTFYSFLTTGQFNWSYVTGSYANGGYADRGSAAAVSVDAVWIGVDDGRIYNFTNSGQLIWSYRTGITFLQSAPALDVSNNVYIGGNDRRLYSIDSTGYLVWSYETGSINLASPSLDSDYNVYFGSYDQNIYSLDSEGSLRWSYATMDVIEYGQAAAISTDTVTIGSTDTALYTLTTNGELSWSYMCAPDFSAPSLNATDAVYVGSIDNRCYKIDSSGSLLWSYYAGGADIHSSPAIDSDTVYFGGIANILFAVGNPSMTETPTASPTVTITETPTATPTVTITPTPLPGLTVWTSKSSYRAGERLAIFVEFDTTYVDWDGYLVIAGLNKEWSVIPDNKLKRGIYPVVEDALEIHGGWGPNQVFSFIIPFGVSGNYTIYCATLMAGLEPTFQNAHKALCQFATTTFNVQ